MKGFEFEGFFEHRQQLLQAPAYALGTSVRSGERRTLRAPKYTLCTGVHFVHRRTLRAPAYTSSKRMR